MRRVDLFLISCLIVGASVSASAGTGFPAEQRTSRYLDSVRQEPLLLLAFLREIPKGGDLHNHLAGAIYAETLIDFAAKAGLCVDRKTSALLPPPCDDSTGKPPATSALRDPALYNKMINAFSMRNWNAARESGHDHFFATFDKFSSALNANMGGSLAEVASRAASDHLQYLELMHTADGMQAALLGEKLGWSDDFGTLRERLLSGGLKNVIASTRNQLDQDEAEMRSILHCDAPEAGPGCAITIRFLYQVLRGLPREQVFAQILVGFELAQSDARVVGLNLVMPEDWYVPMRDFELHMRMLDYLHGLYPSVHISLHAGELVMGLVPPEGLRFHIRDSIERGHAQRIGHGVSVMNERDPFGLLREMSQRNVLVEICLTSNDVILGVHGPEHPLAIYQQNGVPLALATDDQGVSRSDMTHEYLRAVGTYELSYTDLKRMARQSLEHSFLPGLSLWVETREFSRVAACEGDDPNANKLSKGCRHFLDGSERAQMQWKLEGDFARFEKRF